MKKLINSLSRAVQLVLAAPVKLPAKVLQVVKYIALVWASSKPSFQITMPFQIRLRKKGKINAS